MKTEARGLYVHVPFCVRKCNYCDFASGVPKPDFRKRYFDRLNSEARSYAPRKLKIDSIFFGGGTPSLMTPDEFSRLMDTARESFDIAEDTEFTVEINPGTLSEELLSHLIMHGVNRISIGLQSIHENEQKILGRIHNLDDFLNAYKLVRSYGIKNVSVDLMFGIPAQTPKSFEETLDFIIDLSPEHVSAYGLIIEEGTPFFRMKDELSFPSEEEEADMYFLASEKLSRAGFSHYEISNFAKDGFRSRHNMKYWRACEYVGLGLAAHSYLDGVRFGNSRVADEYLSSRGGTRERLSLADRAFEYAMLALRTADGISLSEYEALFGESFLSGRGAALSRFEKAGLLTLDKERLCLTVRGFYLSNTILSELL